MSENKVRGHWMVPPKDKLKVQKLAKKNKISENEAVSLMINSF